MKVVLFGASGMVGQGVLQECLHCPEVESVLSICRRAGSRPHPKLRERVHGDFSDFSAIEGEFSGYDACFFCLGVSSIGMNPEEYQRVTYDFTLAAAQALARMSPRMTFIYVSGSGTDSSERGARRWARVKGRTENALFRLPFRAYAFRPAYLQPLGDVVPKVAWMRVIYALAGPLYPVWKALFPKYVTTTQQLGRAMIHVAREGAAKRVLETPDINELGG